MIGSQFHRTSLIHSDFFGATLRRVRFTSSCLYSATLSGADLTEATFEESILRNADFKGALLGKTEFSGSDLANADFRLTVCHNPDNPEKGYHICTKEDIKQLVKEAKSTCGLIFPGAVEDDNAEDCEGETAVNCTRKHGYRSPLDGANSHPLMRKQGMTRKNLTRSHLTNIS